MKLEMSHIVATVALVIVVVAFIALMLRAMTLHASPISVSVKAKPSPDCRPRWAAARRKPTRGELVPAAVTDAACISHGVNISCWMAYHRYHKLPPVCVVVCGNSGKPSGSRGCATDAEGAADGKPFGLT